MIVIASAYMIRTVAALDHSLSIISGMGMSKGATDKEVNRISLADCAFTDQLSAAERSNLFISLLSKSLIPYSPGISIYLSRYIESRS